VQRKQIAREVIIWMLTILLVLAFGNAGIRKFSDHGGWAVMFRNVGFPVWFRIMIGVIETAAALLLLYPRTAAYGAMAGVVVMIGALATAITQGGRFGLPQPIIALVVSLIVLAMRWRQRATIRGSASTVVAT
jgi:putative oxidoreductase